MLTMITRKVKKQHMSHNEEKKSLFIQNWQELDDKDI